MDYIAIICIAIICLSTSFTANPSKEIVILRKSNSDLCGINSAFSLSFFIDLD